MSLLKLSNTVYTVICFRLCYYNSCNTDDGTGLIPITILQDTGASRSLIVNNILTLANRTSVGVNDSLDGIGGTITVPLHRIALKSDFYSGSVIVGSLPSLPVKGVSMLLGNDLAGSMVSPQPTCVTKPDVITLKSKSQDSNVLETRSMLNSEISVSSSLDVSNSDLLDSSTCIPPRLINTSKDDNCTVNSYNHEEWKGFNQIVIPNNDNELSS
ncbi:Uncharacterised protein g8871 [Pycnogonum litorale]